MRTVRNAAVFVGVLALVMILYPMILVAVGTAFVNGREFQSHFGWLSWPLVIAALVSLIVFLIAGALLSWLVISRHATWWALLLGLAYGVIRIYFSSQSISDAHESAQRVWAGVELAVPLVAACLGAYLLRRYTKQRSTDAKAA